MSQIIMKIRRLLISSEPKNEIESGLKRMYLKRIQEMFKRTISMESIFNVFDEIFHGLSQVSSLSEDLHSFYESLLTITSYYHHSQAGRGNLVARLLETLGSAEKMEFEFILTKIPQFLNQNIELEENELTKLKFDVVNLVKNNLIFCELKMKVYSGCTAGRIELMEKFNKFVKLVIENESFRKCLQNSGIKNIFLIGGILFDIQGEPATLKKDKEWGICYNGLLRGKDDILKTLKSKNIKYEIEEEKSLQRAFVINFIHGDIKINIITVYGNEVIKSIFGGKNKFDIKYFKKLLENMLYDDLWLGQIITLSERALLSKNFKINKKLKNYIISIIKSEELMSEIKKFSFTREDEKILKGIVSFVSEKIRKYDKDLLGLHPTIAEIIISSCGEKYDREDYIADIIQFLSCEEITKNLLN
ncbi:MAG: hypothetical protein ABDH23_03110 [Endomicrobiia bacterium]